MATLDEYFPRTLQFQPHRNADWRVIESADDFVVRMQGTLLPNWPAEVLTEWLHRHSNHMEDYAQLDFTRMAFERLVWPLEAVPGREAFKDGTFCDSFQNIELRAEDNSHDWLAHYMLREGTWNTPIVLLDSSGMAVSSVPDLIRTPYHLLEGHRRLSFLQGLKRLQKAQSFHAIWLVKVL
jgi:hypothetical protein